MRLETETIRPAYVAGAVVESAVSNNGSAVDALREGINAAQSGDRAKARAALLRSTEIDPKSESAWLWLASISEYPEELLVFLGNVLEINPYNARALEWTAATKSLLSKTFVQRGMDAANGGQADFAAQCFHQALEQDQNNASAWHWLANLSDSTEGKLSYLEKVLEIEPENESAKSEYASAKNAINLTLLAEARSAAVAGRKQDANDLLDAFIAENPESEDGWILRSHLADGFEEKIAAFEKVLAVNPENVSAKSGLESLRAIMATVAPTAATEPVAEETDAMENIAFVLDSERQQVNEAVHDKSPTQELVFPAAAAEMQERSNANTEEVVHFDVPDESPEEVEAQPEARDDWAMNTIAFSFAFPGGDLDSAKEGEATEEEKVEVSGESFDFSAVNPVSDSVQDDALYETVAFEPEVPVETHFEEAAAIPSPFDQVVENVVEYKEETEAVSAPFSNSSPFDNAVSFDDAVNHVVQHTDESVSFLPDTASYTNGEMAEASPTYFSEPATEPQIAIEPEAIWMERPIEDAIPMPPMDFTMPEAVLPKTGFETIIFRNDNETPTASSISICPFCNGENPSQAFTCGTCLSTLTLSDLEMLLANTHADKAALREAVSRMDAMRESRPLTENELTNMGIAHLNLRDFQTGYQYLHEASQANPNNVVLGSQVNALLIRLDEIKRQEEAHDAMPREKKILVVDDSATVRKLIAGKLEKCGHQVFCAADGVEAIEQLDTVVPDLVLLDITMPRMDGYQVCKVIRGKDSTKDIPVVMISGKDGFFDKVRGRMAGTTGYITKPFGPETLMKAVETYLKGEEL